MIPEENVMAVIAHAFGMLPPELMKELKACVNCKHSYLDGCKLTGLRTAMFYLCEKFEAKE